MNNWNTQWCMVQDSEYYDKVDPRDKETYPKMEPPIPFKNDSTTQTSSRAEVKSPSNVQKKVGSTWLTELVSKIVCKYARDLP